MTSSTTDTKGGEISTRIPSRVWILLAIVLVFLAGQFGFSLNSYIDASKTQFQQKISQRSFDGSLRNKDPMGEMGKSFASKTRTDDQLLDSDNDDGMMDEKHDTENNDSDDGSAKGGDGAGEESIDEEQIETGGDDKVQLERGEDPILGKVNNTAHGRSRNRKNSKKNDDKAPSKKDSKSSKNNKDAEKDSSDAEDLSDVRFDPKILEKNQYGKFYDISKAEANDPLLDLLPATYRQSENLPVWLKEYFDWHRIQTASMTEENWMSAFEYQNATENGSMFDEEKFVANNRKFLVLHCLAKEKCGGLSDRLKPLLFVIAAAAHQPTGLNGKEHRRILLIRWTRPFPLEEYLLPNEVNWTMPSYMNEVLDRIDRNEGPVKKKKFQVEMKKPSIMFSENYESFTMAGTRFQRADGGREFYQYVVEALYGGTETNDILHRNIGRFWTAKKKDHSNRLVRAIHSWDKIYRDAFHTLFKPSLPVQTLIDKKLSDMDVKPGEFTGAHFRADYGMGQAERFGPEQIERISTRVASCASLMGGGAPVYFASDTASAVQFVENRAGALSGRDITVMTSAVTETPLHLDWDKGDVHDFFPTFVDLLTMAESNCLIMGEGGFGLFASLLSYNASCWYNFAANCHQPEKQIVTSPFAQILPSECCVPHSLERKAAKEYRLNRIKNEGDTLQRYGNNKNDSV